MSTVEVITKYERNKPTKYSFDGGGRNGTTTKLFEKTIGGSGKRL